MAITNVINTDMLSSCVHQIVSLSQELLQFIGRHPTAVDSLIPTHASVAKRHDPRAVLGDVVLVGDEHNRQASFDVQALKDVHHLDAGP
jgi:hypothetical protein